jgi:chromosome partitioning protein
MTDQTVWLVAGQKGGVGKSTISYGLSHYLAKLDQGKVIVCDIDFGQWTCDLWKSLRGDKPLGFEIIKCNSLEDVGKAAVSTKARHVVIDGAPHASAQTLELAKAADRIIIPTGPGIASLSPNVNLAKKMIEQGIGRKQIAFVIMQAGTPADAKSAYETIKAHDLLCVPASINFSTAYGQTGDKGLSILETPYASLRKQAKLVFSNLAK